MFYLSFRRERFAARSSDGLQLPEVGALVAVERTVVNPLLTSQFIESDTYVALQGCHTFAECTQREQQPHLGHDNATVPFESLDSTAAGRFLIPVI
jgi:hypothetical protein